MASSLLFERFTHLPESVIAGFTDLQDSLKTKAKYDMDSFKELFHDPRKALAENKAYWIKLGIRATTIIAAAFAGWACSFAENRDKPVDIQPATKPQFGLITESGGNELLASQLDIVKKQSGNLACKPMIIGADSGKPNLGETTGLCDLDGTTQIVMRKVKDGKTEVINKPLVARSNGEVGYQKTNGEWVVVIKTSENGNTWVFPNGETMPIEDQTPIWEQVLGKILEPGGSAVAAEVTPLPTETPTSTPTLAPTPSWTPTLTPSLTPIPPTIGATVVKSTPIPAPASATPKPESPNRLPGTPDIMPDGSYPLGDNDHWSTPPLSQNPCIKSIPNPMDTLNVQYNPSKKFPWGETRYVCTYSIKYGDWTLMAKINYAPRP